MRIISVLLLLCCGAYVGVASAEVPAYPPEYAEPIFVDYVDYWGTLYGANIYFWDNDTDTMYVHIEPITNSYPIGDFDFIQNNIQYLGILKESEDSLFSAWGDLCIPFTYILTTRDGKMYNLSSSLTILYEKSELYGRVIEYDPLNNIVSFTDVLKDIFTQDELDQAVLNERQRWDAGDDNKIGLAEAIRALQIMSGIHPQP